jgi:hypothetical protein
MKKLFALVLFLPTFLFAQNSTDYWSLDGFVSSMNYSGEVSEGGDVGTWINEMRPEFGLRLIRHFNYRTSLGVEASYGNVYASDENRGNQMRNFVVNTEIVQANLVFELNFKKYGKYFQRNANTPFIRIGIGGMFYTPQLNTNAAYPDSLMLYPGSHATFNAQGAFGWKWRVSYHSSLSLDIHYNITGTSYLEGFDLKEKANPTDGIYGIRLTFSYGLFE